MHTPGDWTVTKTGTPNCTWVTPTYRVAAGNLVVARVDRRRKEFPANAQLIASAPKMLETLKVLLEDYEQRKLRLTDWDAVRGLIAEATETP